MKRRVRNVHPEQFTDEQAALATKLFDTIRVHLAGHDPAIQGAVLADLLALLLAGHRGDGADEVREVFLKEHIAIVRQLIPVNEAMLSELIASGHPLIGRLFWQQTPGENPAPFDQSAQAPIELGGGTFRIRWDTKLTQGSYILTCDGYAAGLGAFESPEAAKQCAHDRVFGTRRH
jgi:hypothetical protein